MGGPNRELVALTGTTDVDVAKQTLQNMCDAALADATKEVQNNIDTWEYLENEPNAIGVEDFFDRSGFLNNTETGNFQPNQTEIDVRQARRIRTLLICRRRYPSKWLLLSHQPPNDRTKAEKPSRGFTRTKQRNRF